MLRITAYKLLYKPMAKVMGNGDFRPRTAAKPLNRFQWNLKYRTTHRRPPGMQTLTSTWQRGWSGRIVSLPLSFFLSFFCFLCQGHRSHCASDLDQWGLKPRRSAQGSAFWGSERCALNLRGKIPQNWIFGAVNRTFKPEREKIQNLITWKLPSRSWQNFYRRYAPQMRLRGWSHNSPKQIQDDGGRHL